MHDPNFPPNLSIQPSISSGRSAEDNLAFDQEVGIKKYGIAGRVWEAAYILASYTTSPPFNPESKISPAHEFDPPCSLFSGHARPITLIEVGSGTGYAGIHIAHQLEAFYRRRHTSSAGANVVLTDLQNVVPLLEEGIWEHGCTADARTRVEARALEWGNQEHADTLCEELRRLEAMVTHVLCSDLVYFPHLYPQLLRTLLTLTSPPFCDNLSSPEIIIGYKVRSLAKEIPFWQVFGTWFSFVPVLVKQHEADRIEGVWSRFGHAYDTHVFVAVRRPESYMWDIPAEDSKLMNGFGPSPPRLDDTFESLLLLEIATDE